MSIFAKKNINKISRFVLLTSILGSVFFGGIVTSNAISVESSANPAWPNKCGVNIGLLIDRSNSIDTDEGNSFKSAANSFVDALAGTASQIAVAQFRKTATQTLGLTSVQAAGGVTTVKNTINAYTFGTNDPAGSTNWESAFYTQQSVNADVIIIITDGNPTSRDLDGEGGTGNSDPLDYNIDAGVTRANELKAQGKRVVAVGIGDGVDTTHLAAVSGPTANDDYFAASFDTLNSKLTEIATTLCGGTVTVQKQVKNSDGSYTATNGWDYTATNAQDNTKTTSGDGSAEFSYDDTPRSTTITETLKHGYELESIVCTKNNQTIGDVNLQNNNVALTVNSNDIISCVFKNIPEPGTITVIKNTINGDDTFEFESNTPLENFDIKTEDGTGSTETVSLPPGRYFVMELLDSEDEWELTDFTCNQEIVEEEEEEIELNRDFAEVVDDGFISFLVEPGEDVVCTFENTNTSTTTTTTTTTTPVTVLGTTVTRVDPPVQVLGTSVSALPRTGFEFQAIFAFAFTLLFSGALFLGASRRRRIVLKN